MLLLNTSSSSLLLFLLASSILPSFLPPLLSCPASRLTSPLPLPPSAPHLALWRWNKAAYNSAVTKPWNKPSHEARLPPKHVTSLCLDFLIRAYQCQKLSGWYNYWCFGDREFGRVGMRGGWVRLVYTHKKFDILRQMLLHQLSMITGMVHISCAERMLWKLQNH